MGFRSLSVWMCGVCALLMLVAAPADAKRKTTKKRSNRPAAAASAVNDDRYAALIMNPVTGEIYHQRNPDERRYPASLTKMMTLYLLFEALEQQKITLGTEMEVSEYASEMPQTNLALTPGDEIPVEVAIKALVIRSANDVSVVVAEHLAGDVERFAERMTAKARILGMRNTVFRNPNGLPNGGQYTTARDMAKLGIALKRDFPRYYPYFSTRQFSWNGVTYYTHNRVMLRYAGTDGIKTGFIGASGFNLVTSVTRGGRPLVGVVLGGSSGRWRDDRMIDLLDDSYQIIASRGAQRGKLYADNLPMPKNISGNVSKISPSARGIEPPAAQSEPEILPPMIAEKENFEEENDPDGAAVGDTSPKSTPKRAAVESTAERALVPAKTVAVAPPLADPVKAPAVAPPVAAAKPAVPASLPFTVKAAAPTPATPPPAVPTPTSPAGGEQWGIQVGAFSSHELAVKAVNQAYQLARTALQGARIGIAGPEANGAPVHRARLVNIAQSQAKSACEKLIANNTPCFIFKAN